ncbi:MAG: RdgB/HAM1 family non-canonical purine NTP pyrophosphatase [Anaerolineales bacterium]|nr:RdgB/HAM1 family non-canonical purine NTP pyrophosphatase [Anaerolineales bacterium]
MKPTIIIATSNPGKLHEFSALLASQPFQLLSPEDMAHIPPIEETGTTYSQNARLKAAAYARAGHTFALADDSGLEVDVLDGAPGLHSARLAGPGRSDADRRAVLLEALLPFPQPWTARFRCVAALASPTGGIWTAEGICSGRIIPVERGEHGFGYDPIFFLEQHGKTMAELPEDVKNLISHRSRATAAILPAIYEALNLPWRDHPI